MFHERGKHLINILFISPNSPYESVGGIERYITNLIEYSQNQTKFKAFIMLPTSKEEHCEQKKCVSIFFDKSIDLTKANTIKKISQNAHLFAKKLESIIISQKIDIICAENFPVGLPPAYSILLNMVAVQYKIPLILQMHSFTVTDIQTELVNQLMWDRISCVSKSIAGDCFKKGVDINLISTSYLGVNTDVFCGKTSTISTIRKRLGISSKDKIILTATRIIQGRNNILQAKGLITLIQSFSRISSKHPDIKLVIAVAKAPDRLNDEFEQSKEMLMGYIKLHNIESRTLVQTFALEEIPDVYQSADIFVLASENETFGQVFIEAMSSGLPVIGTKVGGVPEIIKDSHNGYLIQPNDISILTQKIEKLLEDSSTRDEFIKNGLETVNKKFTLNKLLDNFINYLEKNL